MQGGGLIGVKKVKKIRLYGSGMGKLKVLRGGMIFARSPTAKMAKKAVKTSSVVGEAERGSSSGDIFGVGFEC